MEERNVEIETSYQKASTEKEHYRSSFGRKRQTRNKINETEEIPVNGKEDEFHF